MESFTPTRLDLKKSEKLEIDWADGVRSVYPISFLRGRCPCAQCKEEREAERKTKPLLRVLAGDHSKPLSAVGAELVGNYAIQIDWSDQHGSGIYSFQYLREIWPEAEKLFGAVK
jgi:DUF971 family protein